MSTSILQQQDTAEELELLTYLLKQQGLDIAEQATIDRRPHSEAIPLSFIQERLWFLEQWHPGNAAYNIPAAIRLTGTLDMVALAASLGEVIHRHEILRTTIATEAGTPRVEIHPDGPFQLPYKDLRTLDAPAREAELARGLRADAHSAFDLARGPLLRAVLYHLDEAEYLLSLATHHIVWDGWSTGVFMRELSACYAAFSAGEPVALPPLPIQYSDFAHWQRRQEAVFDRQISYWKEQLADPPVLEWQSARARPATASSHGAHLLFTLGPAESQDLRDLSQQGRVTLFMTLLAAFNVLLYRYTGQTDLIVGSPIANRSRPELEGLIGCFINMLALRCDLSGQPAFLDLLDRLHETTLDAYAHQEVPFEKLVDELQVERRLDRTPLFQVVFALQNAPRSRLELPGLTLEALPVETNTSKYDLTLSIMDMDAQLHGLLEYSTDLFDAAAAERLIGHFKTLLAGIVADPTRPIADLPLLTAPEYDQLVYAWNATQIDYPTDHSLHEFVAAQVARRPDAIAVVYEHDQLTYAELDRRANQLAHYLLEHGAGPDRLIGICAERSLEMVIGLLGILKAGSAYVPCDPSYPAERLAYFLADSHIPLLLTQAHLLDRLPEHSAQVVCLDRDWPLLARQPGESPAGEVLPRQAAYMIYTSGSTGRPKGAINTHRGIVNRLLWMQDAYQLTGDDRVLQKTSFSFDVSVWEFFWPLITGARIVLARPGGHRDSSYLARCIAEHAITTLHFVPSMLQTFIEEPGVAQCRSLKRVICSGEALPYQLQERFFARLDAELHNLYGPTEAAIDVTFWHCRPTPGDQSVPIGMPIANTQMYILDARMQPVPIGLPGELYIAGVNLARGYHQRPELTAERFIPNPFTDQRLEIRDWRLSNSASSISNLQSLISMGTRLYKTGDLARYRPDGAIEFLGRIDHQVKLRGFRIEPGEIEATLLRHPDIREAVVMARSDEAGEQQLVAYLVAAADQQPGIMELREYVGAVLPDYMIPRSFVFLDAFPLNANGKLDRRALPDPGRARPDLGKAYVAPATPTEVTLARIWADVLGVERVGVEDNYFALGGDSIRSVRVIAQARAAGAEFSLQELFQHQTIRELAELVRPADPALAMHRIVEPFALISAEDRADLPAELVDAYPLTRLQSGMFYHMELHPDAPVYHNVDSLHFRAPLEPALFEQAVQYVVDRHPILRTSFELTRYSEPLQLVHPAASCSVPIHDLRGQTPEEQEAAIKAFFEAEKLLRFDLSRPPLLRLHLHRRTDATFQLTVTECHPIFDGWSLTSTLVEIFRRYLALLAGEKLAPATPPAGSFADFVYLERQAIASEEHRRYWHEQLRGMTVTQLPRRPDHPPRTGELAIRRAPVLLSAGVSQGLKRLSLEASVPIKSVLLAAHLKVLSMMSGQLDAVTGLVSNGRPETVDGEEIRGLFLNTLPFRQHVLPGRWIDLVRATLATERDMLPFRRYPLAQLQHELGDQPLFEATFNYVHFHALEGMLGRGKMELLELSHTSEDTHFTFLAAFSTSPVNRQITLVLVYNEAEISPALVESIVHYYRNVLEAMAADPQARHENASYLPIEEQQRYLVEWNATDHPYRHDRCVYEWFAAQAAETPDRIAAVLNEQMLTFRALNERAGSLAQYLRSLGIGPDDLVGLCMRRSLDMLVGIWGILKAGAAYLPLDPAYPAERLAAMLDDAGVALILAQHASVEAIPAGDPRPILLDADWETIARAEPGAAPAQPGAENLAYVIYTSGSTGRPKGIMVTHRGLVNYLTWCLHAYPLVDGVGALVHSSISFDLTVTGLFAPLLAGRTIYLLDENQGVEGLGQALQIHNDMSLVKITPAHLDVLSQQIPAEAAARSTRAFIIGGEQLLPRQLDFWYEHAPTTVLINEYGPTETVVGCCVYQATGADAGDVVPIGRPIINTQLYLLDDAFQPVPPGVPGELYIGGEGVARGYLGRPDLTAERFIPNPFADQRLEIRDWRLSDTESPISNLQSLISMGTRLYKTGDLARLLPDGNLEFLGRRDDQIKLRGFRIELGDIEAALSRHPAVRENAVVVWGESTSEKRLVAYVAPTGAASLDGDELRRALAEQLPAYMVPASFILLEALPLTPNGKVDRRALPAPEQIAERPRAPLDLPRSALELQLTQIWEELLGIYPIGVTENFFELGGHSLLAMRLMARIRKTFRQSLPLAQLLQAGTVEQLALLLHRPATEQASSLVAIQPEGAAPPFFCVHPAGGQVLVYYHLARHLGREQPFYALQPQGIDGTTPRHTSVAEMAAHYVEALRTIQPDGPYYLGGWSVGGVIAFEMAQQLRAQQQPIAALLMIDSWNTHAGEASLSDAVLMQSFVRVLGLALHGDDDMAAAFIADRQIELPAMLDQVLRRAIQEKLLPPDVDAEQIRQLYEQFRVDVLAGLRYKAAPYAGPITLIQAGERYNNPPQDETLGWGTVAKEIDIVKVPGTHHSMVREPHVQRVAEEVRNRLEAARIRISS